MRHSSPQNTKPVFVVVGAAKSGTSSLNNYLNAHPDIHMCPKKDVACYFCRDYGLPLTLEEYKEMLFPAGDYRVSGDCCHAYLTDEKSAEWIKEEFPDAKIIMILRNPVDKIYSQYHWLVNHGYEYLPTFEEALEAEDERFDKNVWKARGLLQGYKPNYLYFRSALYSTQIEKYLEAFPRENVLFLKFDDLKKHSGEFMRGVYNFLEVDPDFEVNLKVYNQRSSVRSIKFQYFCMSKLMKVLPTRIVRVFMKLNMSSKINEKISSKTKAKLLERYSQDITKTELLTGLSLQSWLGKPEGENKDG